jgi:hypothetical protein
VEGGAGGVFGDGGFGEEVVGEAEVMGDGVDDDECEVGDGGDGFFEAVEGGLGVVFGGDEGVEIGEEVDVIEVGVEAFEAWAEGVGGVVVGV